jgi:hypothetical protein
MCTGGTAIVPNQRPRRPLASTVYVSCWLCVGPLVATIRAQAQAALTTLDFVQSVGFDENGDAISVEFVFNRTNGTTGIVEENIVSVPLLTIVPIPYLRVSLAAPCPELPSTIQRVVPLVTAWQVQEMTIEFNAKINSVTKQSSERTAQTRWNDSRRNWWWWGGSHQASFSSQSKSQSSNEEQRTFSLKVFVRAVQDDMPGGMRRVLNLLEEGFIDLEV